MLGLASSAGSYAFNTASSYVWRSDASTSTESQTGPTTQSQPRRSKRDTSRVSSSPSRSRSSSNRPVPDENNRQRVARPAHRRRESGLPSSSSTTAQGTSSASANGSASIRNGSSSSRGAGSASAARKGKGTAAPASASSTAGLASQSGKTANGPADKSVLEAIALVDEMNVEEDLYKILGVNKRAKSEEVRRAFLGRSRICHPDKLPDYPPATPAFQRLSYAYETISKPSSRRIYDLGGGRSFDAGRSGVPREPPPNMGDETLNGVLRNVFNEFLAGDFEMIRVFVSALNDGNPSLNLGDEAVDNLEGAFRRVREVLLSGQKYFRLIRFELIRLYQIQSDLRALSYFDVIGRLRLTLALTRVTLEIPMVLDKAMREEVVVRQPRNVVPGSSRASSSNSSSASDDDLEDEGATGASASGGAAGRSGELQRRGLLGPRIKGALVIACKVLEKGEKFGL